MKTLESKSMETVVENLAKLSNPNKKESKTMKKTLALVIAMVMYLGKCVERATSDELFANPRHPYTKALLSAIPVPDISMRNKEIKVIKGEVVSPVDPKPGCRFAARCEYCQERCTQEAPTLKEVSPGHFVACHLCEN